VSRDDILGGVREVLRAHCEVDRPVDASTEIAADLELDSLKQLTLVVELENRFEICFEPGDEQGVVTIGDVVDLVQRTLTAET